MLQRYHTRTWYIFKRWKSIQWLAWFICFISKWQFINFPRNCNPILITTKIIIIKITTPIKNREHNQYIWSIIVNGSFVIGDIIQIDISYVSTVIDRFDWSISLFIESYLYWPNVLSQYELISLYLLTQFFYNNHQERLSVEKFWFWN